MSFPRHTPPPRSDAPLSPSAPAASTATDSRAIHPAELVSDPCGVDAFLGGVEDPVGEIPPPFGRVGRRPENAALNAINKLFHLRFRLGNVRAGERLGIAGVRDGLGKDAVRSRDALALRFGEVRIGV